MQASKPKPHHQPSFRLVSDPHPAGLSRGMSLNTNEVYQGLRLGAFTPGTVLQDPTSGRLHTVVSIDGKLALEPPSPRLRKFYRSRKRGKQGDLSLNQKDEIQELAMRSGLESPQPREHPQPTAHNPPAPNPARLRWRPGDPPRQASLRVRDFVELLCLLQKLAPDATFIAERRLLVELQATIGALATQGTPRHSQLSGWRLGLALTTREMIAEILGADG